MSLFRKEAEAYGEAWARAYVADFDRVAVDSKKLRFDLLAVQQDRLKSFAEAISLPDDSDEILRRYGERVKEAAAKFAEQKLIDCGNSGADAEYMAAAIRAMELP